MPEDISDEEKGKNPLSNEAWNWIMLLSGEINKEEMKLPTYWNAALIILIALLTVAVTALVASLRRGVTPIEDDVYKILAWAVIICEIVIITIFEKRYRSPHQKRLKLLINIRHDIMISGKLTDFSEIQRRWEEYIREYYGKFLEKLEMNEAKKELNKRKEKHEKIDSGKRHDEQGEVLQALQSDIRDIKERLQEIRGILDGTSKFSSWCVLGSVYIAIGLAIIGTIVSFSSESLKIGGIIFGVVMFLAGMFMIKGAYYAGTNVSRYPNNASMNALKELRHTNKWLFRGVLLMACTFLTLIVLITFSFGL